MAFAILRTSKLKSFGEIGSSLSHNYRTRKTPNADATRTHKNEHEIRSAYSAMEAIKGRMPDKVRKNAVLCVEYLITASPEWSEWGKEGEKEFFDKSLEFLKAKHGAENVITTSIHRDETTPHLIAYVVPLDEKGKLNAREFLGGRQKLSQMQTTFAEEVKSLGLERGLEGSKAEHKTIKEYYAEIQKPVPAVKNNKVLAIKMLDPNKDQPKLGFLDRFNTKEEYGAVIMDIVYDNVQKQIDTFNDDVKISFSEMHVNFEKKLAAEKMRTDKFQKAHEQAVYEIRGLVKKYESVAEYKRLFPSEFEELEQRLREDVEGYHNKIEQEKYRKQYESDMIIRREREAAQKQENDFKTSIPIKHQKRLDAQYEHFVEKIAECISEPEKRALKRIYDERNAVLRSNPVSVMNEVLKTDKSNYYFGLCSNLFEVKSRHDFDSALKECIKFFELTAPSYDEGIGFHESSVTRKVCAASLNQLDNLLIGYGSEYVEQAEVLKKHLLACEEKAEQNSFKYVLNDVTSEEQRKKYTAENSMNHDFSIRQPVKEIEKEKGFDFEL